MGIDPRSRRLAAAWALAALAGVACSSRDVITTPHSVHRDLAYAEASDRNVLDVYVPKARASAVPLVLWIHGGAFRVGDKSRPEGLDAFLADGFAVAAMNYRLTDEAKWPAQLDDVTAAVAFLKSKGPDFGVDADRIALFGASAGGFLAATAGIAFAGRPELEVDAVVDWCGPVDFTTMDADMEASGVPRLWTRNDAPDSAESALVGLTVAEHPEAARAVSPLAYLARVPQGAKVPPFLIMHGDRDPVVAKAQSERLRDALAASPATSRVELVILENTDHGDGAFDEPGTIQRVIAFLRETLRAG